MAECSESTGTTWEPLHAAASLTSSPAHTSVSLLAKAMRLPARMAAKVGRSPTIPTTAVSTVSAASRLAASSRPSIPSATRMGVSARRRRRDAAASGSIITASSGWKRRHCFSICSTSRLAVKAATRMPQAAITSSDCRPMEPVEPSREIQRFCSMLCSSHGGQEPEQQFDQGRAEDHAVKPIQHAAVSGKNVAEILDSVLPLDIGK